MQLNRTTDYAIRILVHLAKHKQDTATNMSKELGITKTYIARMMRNTVLLDKYLLPTVGKKGGYQLKKDPSEITLFSVIKDMELTSFISCCLEDDLCDNCPSFKKEKCSVLHVYEDIQEEITNILGNVTIQGLVDRQRSKLEMKG